MIIGGMVYDYRLKWFMVIGGTVYDYRWNGL